MFSRNKEEFRKENSESALDSYNLKSSTPMPNRIKRISLVPDSEASPKILNPNNFCPDFSKTPEFLSPVTKQFSLYIPESSSQFEYQFKRSPQSENTFVDAENWSLEEDPFSDLKSAKSSQEDYATLDFSVDDNYVTTLFRDDNALTESIYKACPKYRGSCVASKQDDMYYSCSENGLMTTAFSSGFSLIKPKTESSRYREELKPNPFSSDGFSKSVQIPHSPLLCKTSILNGSSSDNCSLSSQSILSTPGIHESLKEKFSNSLSKCESEVTSDRNTPSIDETWRRCVDNSSERSVLKKGDLNTLDNIQTDMFGSFNVSNEDILKDDQSQNALFPSNEKVNPLYFTTLTGTKISDVETSETDIEKNVCLAEIHNFSLDSRLETIAEESETESEISNVEAMQLSENFAENYSVFSKTPDGGQKGGILSKEEDSCFNDELKQSWETDLFEKCTEGMNADIDSQVLAPKLISTSNSNTSENSKTEDEPMRMNEGFSKNPTIFSKNPDKEPNQEIANKDKNSCFENKLDSAQATDIFEKCAESMNVDIDSKILLKMSISKTNSNVNSDSCKDPSIEFRRNNLALNETVITRAAAKPKADVQILLDLFEVNNCVSKHIITALSSKFLKGASQTEVLKILRTDSMLGTVTKLKQDISRFFKAAEKAEIIERKNRRYFLKFETAKERGTPLRAKEKENANHRNLLEKSYTPKINEGRSKIRASSMQRRKAKTPVTLKKELKKAVNRRSQKSVHKMQLRSSLKQKDPKFAFRGKRNGSLLL